MKLKYYEGKNFGDALNSIIFPSLLPDFFDQNPEVVFLGIGSILGFIRGEEATKKIVIFSTGFAYDHAPKICDMHDVRCVRGPLTAQVLGINSNLAVADGALLARSIDVFNKSEKKEFRYSFIPHYESEPFFDRWNQVFSKMGVNFISPGLDPHEVITQIKKSEIVFTEALHGAILCDCFRIPWVPIKIYEHINEFKWRDYLLTVNMDLKFERIFRLYSESWINFVMEDKLRFKQHSKINHGFSKIYKYYQKGILEDKFINDFMKLIKKAEPRLSNESILSSKHSQLLEILANIEKDYR